MHTHISTAMHMIFIESVSLLYTFMIIMPFSSHPNSHIFFSAIILSFVVLSPHFTTFIHAAAPFTPASICHRAHDSQQCLQMVSEAIGGRDGLQESNVIDVVKTFLVKSIPHMRMAMESAGYMIRRTNGYNKEVGALSDCLELMDMSIDRVGYALSAIANWSKKVDSDNLHTWISSVLTNHVTCLDGIENTAQNSSLKILLKDLISRTRTSLAIFACLSDSEDDILQPVNEGYPEWVLRKDRKLIEGTSFEADVVVAKDGSGTYRTIQEAVESAPVRSTKRYVIYVKKGVYEENVEVAKKKKNLMIFGDGMDWTVIVGNRSVVDGSTTFKSATLAVAGDGFILQDIWVKNVAGPRKHQAVAIRVNADQCVINRCKIDAYQDTLYAHSLRQFYRECSILGTMDFILGNAAVVLQKCQIVSRKPMPRQKNIITAQGRVDPYQNTAISIQDCKIIPSPGLEPIKNSIQTYLGRPWKEFSRTVVMESYIDGHIEGAGWTLKRRLSSVRTMYFGEYQNRGPGASTRNRVRWPGFHVITDPDEARKFTVTELIQGGSWLSSTGVSFTEGL